MKISHSLKHDQWFGRRLLGSLTIGLISTIGLTAQANANTLAQSGAAVELFNFSHRPQAANAQTFKAAIAIGTPRQVSASAFADAEFLSQNGTVAGRNVSLSLASGTGANYSAEAKSEASVIGVDFQVGANQTFSFDWQSSLLVNATSDSPGEHSFASGLFGFEIYTRDANQQLHLVDTLDLFGSDDASHGTLFDFNASSGFNFTKNQTANQFNLAGRYTKAVAQATQFTVFELKRNQVSVAAPEPGSAIAFVALGTTAFVRKRQRAA
jgi:hypothetical protein